MNSSGNNNGSEMNRQALPSASNVTAKPYFTQNQPAGQSADRRRELLPPEEDYRARPIAPNGSVGQNGSVAPIRPDQAQYNSHQTGSVRRDQPLYVDRSRYPSRPSYPADQPYRSNSQLYQQNLPPYPQSYSRTGEQPRAQYPNPGQTARSGQYPAVRPAPPRTAQSAQLNMQASAQPSVRQAAPPRTNAPRVTKYTRPKKNTAFHDFLLGFGIGIAVFGTAAFFVVRAVIGLFA